MVLEGGHPSVLLTGVTGCPTMSGTPLRGPDDSFTLAQRLRRPGAVDTTRPTTSPPPQAHSAPNKAEATERQTNASSSSADFFRCKDDWDCSLGGSCWQGRCNCDSWLSGEDCSYLNFELVDKSKLGYLDERYSSWGGNAVYGRDRRWHLFVAELACKDESRKRCGLGSWTTHSQVAHAVSDAPEGPYRRRSLALPMMHHNPTVHSGPSGLWYLYTISNWNGPIVVSKSDDQGKSWSDGRPGKQVSPYQNPGPLLLPNGSVLMYYRDDFHLPEPTCCNEGIGLSLCPGPMEPCEPLGRPLFNHTAEDPFVFADHRGNYHMLMNAMPYQCEPKYQQGAHAWSRDGVHWSEPRVGAFNTTIQFNDGTSITCQRRERPQMVRDPSGVPLVLFTGLTGCPKFEGLAHNGPLDSFTVAQLLKRPSIQERAGLPGVIAAILVTAGVLMALWRLLRRSGREVAYTAVEAQSADEEVAMSPSSSAKRRPHATVMGDSRSPG